MFSNQYHLVSNLNNSLRIGRAHNYRVMLVLAGEANQQLKSICDGFKSSVNGGVGSRMTSNVTLSSRHILHVPDRHSNSDVSDEINSLLGDEHACVIFDAQNKFEERLFAAAAGTITGGGLLVLQTPSLRKWAGQHYHSSVPDNQSPFISRFCKKLALHHSLGLDATSTDKRHFKTLQDIPDDAAFFIAATAAESGHSQSNPDDSAQSNGWKIEQDSMLESLVKNLQSKVESVSVVQGDRGRGKSTLIGRAMNHLNATETNKQRSISITANRRSACDILLKHTLQPIPFLPIEKALSITHDVLIVEEAGSIPIPVLEQLLQQSQSIIFATTVQGYEGAGRGFAIRFAKRLDKLMPGWLTLNPVLPIRWSTGDPLEAFVNDALLLKAQLPEIRKSNQLTPDNSQVSVIERHRLANDESLLAQVYGLLVQAHYQTTPADLRNLLDQPGLLLFAQKTNQVLTGAALVALEGEIPNDLHQAIMHKQRRLADQILPQLLAQSSGETNALQERFARVVRIAIHPAIHQRGFGTHLFEHLYQQLTTNTSGLVRVNSVGASFGADEHTLSFWLKQGLKPIHYGYKTNPRSALRAACLICSNHSSIKKSIDKACHILRVNTQAQWSQGDSNDPVQKLLLSATMSIDGMSLSSTDTRQLIHDFCHARRSFIDTVGLLLTSELFNNYEAVHKIVDKTLDGYRGMSAGSRLAAENQLRSVLLETGVFAKFD